MEKIARKLTDLVGNTPLLELSNYNRSNDLKARLIVKIESFNPAGSVKDRIALAMIEDACHPLSVQEGLFPCGPYLPEHIHQPPEYRWANHAPCE